MLPDVWKWKIEVIISLCQFAYYRDFMQHNLYSSMSSMSVCSFSALILSVGSFDR